MNFLSLLFLVAITSPTYRQSNIANPAASMDVQAIGHPWNEPTPGYWKFNVSP